jgi:hypothetical protein
LAIDFTNMNELGVIVANQKFDHMLFHAALTFSKAHPAIRGGPVCGSKKLVL